MGSSRDWDSRWLVSYQAVFTCLRFSFGQQMLCRVLCPLRMGLCLLVRSHMSVLNRHVSSTLCMKTINIRRAFTRTLTCLCRFSFCLSLAPPYLNKGASITPTSSTFYIHWLFFQFVLSPIVLWLKSLLDKDVLTYSLASGFYLISLQDAVTLK